MHENTGTTFFYTARIVEHDWNLSESVKASCTQDGADSYLCTLCNSSDIRNEVPAFGHTEVPQKGVIPGCEAEGLTDGTVCSVCGVTLSGFEDLPATGHNWSEWVVQIEPTVSEPGFEVRECLTCGFSEGRDIPIIDPTEPPATDIPGDTGFVDVVEGSFYENAVMWAVENGITNGVDTTHFAPGATCNRGQVVTFLWRAAGSPEPASSSNPFTDVVEGKFYYKAVLWAVEEGITNGTSITTFSPDANCTRGQVVTYLRRTLGNPNASSQNNPFTDVEKGRFYYDAVLWAVEAGVTNGMTATTFAPDASCTRGQIVTFLYRALA